MKILLVLVTLLFSRNTESINRQAPKTYCNNRFGYCINYPLFLIPQRESYNGDGRVFINKEGKLILTVFGRLNMDVDGNAIPLSKQYAADTKELLAAKVTITYKKLGKGFYVLSGTKQEKIFYRKVILKGDAFCFALLEYAAAGKAIYDSVSADIFRSFKCY